MTTGPNEYAKRAVSAFRNGLAIREEAFFDSAVLMPLADPSEG